MHILLARRKRHNATVRKKICIYCWPGVNAITQQSGKNMYILLARRKRHNATVRKKCIYCWPGVNAITQQSGKKCIYCWPGVSAITQQSGQIYAYTVVLKVSPTYTIWHTAAKHAGEANIFKSSMRSQKTLSSFHGLSRCSGELGNAGDVRWTRHYRFRTIRINIFSFQLQMFWHGFHHRRLNSKVCPCRNFNSDGKIIVPIKTPFRVSSSRSKKNG